MARIVFEARMITPQMHGISRYAHHLLLELLRRDTDNDYVVLHQGSFVAEQTAPFPRATAKAVELKLYGVRELWALPRMLGRLGADLYYSPTYFAPPVGACPHIQTVHDLTQLWRGMRNWRYRAYYDLVVGRGVHRAARVVTETEYVAARLRQRFGLSADRIAVVPSGVGLGVELPPDESRRREVLCLVNEKPHKNVGGALRAMVRLRASGFDGRLVLVGQLGERLGRQVSGQEWIEWHPFLSQEELVRRYARASVFLFPSFSEGFGYPPLEAMLAGTPVVSSRASCLPEVLGDAALYADPDQPAQMAEQMARILESPPLAAEMADRGRAQAARYSWDSMGREILALIGAAV